MRLVLIDFNTCENVGEAKPRFDAYTTYPYRAPELWPTPVPSKHLQPAADVWSFGTCLFEAASGHMMFKSATEYEEQTYVNIKHWSRAWMKGIQWSLDSFLKGASPEWASVGTQFCHPVACHRMRFSADPVPVLAKLRP